MSGWQSEIGIYLLIHWWLVLCVQRYAFLSDLEVDFYSLLLYMLIIWWSTHNLTSSENIKQESPPAWTQEAYCLQEDARCWPPPSSWTWPPRQLDLTPPCQLDLTPPAAGPDPPGSWTWPPQQLDLTPPGSWPDPPGSWTWPDPPLAAGPDPPTPYPPWQLDLTPPPGSWTWPPPPASWTWPPPSQLDLTPPPKCGQSENITFPILRMRAVITTFLKVSIVIILKNCILFLSNLTDLSDLLIVKNRNMEIKSEIKRVRNVSSHICWEPGIGYSEWPETHFGFGILDIQWNLWRWKFSLVAKSNATNVLADRHHSGQMSHSPLKRRRY